MALRTESEAAGVHALRLNKCLTTLVELAASNPDTPLGDADVMSVLVESAVHANALVVVIHGEDAG